MHGHLNVKKGSITGVSAQLTLRARGITHDIVIRGNITTSDI